MVHTCFTNLFMFLTEKARSRLCNHRRTSRGSCGAGAGKTEALKVADEPAETVEEAPSIVQYSFLCTISSSKKTAKNGVTVCFHYLTHTHRRRIESNLTSTGKYTSFVVDTWNMSVSGKRGVGIPIVMLHDAEGGIITVELKTGETYRGVLDEAADNMNFTMTVRR
jgi:hypothetical protein